MSEPVGLHLVQDTGEIDELTTLTHAVLVERVRSLKAAKEGLTGDLARAENDLKEKRATISGLKGQLTRQDRIDGLDVLIEDLIVYWRNTLRGPQSTVEVAVDSKRGEAVRKRLKALIAQDDDPGLADPDREKRADALESAAERAGQRIRSAIDGCARAPFAGDYGKRYAEPGQGRRRKDELAYILRDEVTMEKFAAVVEAEPSRLAYRAMLADRLRREPMLVRVLASLGPECHGEILARCVRYCATREAAR